MKNSLNNRRWTLLKRISKIKRRSDALTSLYAALLHHSCIDKYLSNINAIINHDNTQKYPLQLNMMRKQDQSQ